jgi:hypothetical protein
MDMIRHHDRHFKAVPFFVIVDATSRHNVARPLRQNTAELGTECDEVGRIVALHVRQVATVELHWRILA